MPTISDSAICIRHWDFSETSQTVSLFARSNGILRGIAKGARRERGRFSGGIDLLARGQVIAIVKPGRDLATLTDWDVTDLYWPLRQDLGCHRVGLYFADLVHHMVTDHDPHEELFDALTEALAALRTLPRAADDRSTDMETMRHAIRHGNETALLRFQWAVLRETGYKPELMVDAATGGALPLDEATLAFSPRAGGVVADTGEPGRWRLRRETVEVLRQLEANETTAPVRGSLDTLHRANRLLASYLREILNREPPTYRWVFPAHRSSS